MSNFFGYITLTAGTREFANIGASGLSGVLIGNESGYTVTITLQGANTSRSLYPGLVDWFPIHPGFNGTIQIDPVALLANTSSWPGNYLQIDTFGLGEAPTGIYPLALSRTFNIGNMVNTSMGNATNIVNDGNVAGTQIIEATAGAEASSSVSVLNTGSVTLGNNSHTGTISSGASSNLVLNVPTGQKESFQVNSAEVLRVDSTGLTLASGALNLVTGTLTRVKFGVVTYAGVNPITVTHGLGTTPTVVLVTNLLSGGSPILNISALGATTFSIQGASAFNSGDKVSWLAIA